MNDQPPLSCCYLLPSSAMPGNTPSDLFVGDWQGEGLVAQVIPRGSGNYQINFLPEFDVKCEPLAVMAGRVTDGELRFEQDGWSGQAKGERMTGVRPGIGQAEGVVQEMLSAYRRASVPNHRRRAVILFDGSGFDEWEVQSGEELPLRRSHGSCARISCGSRRSTRKCAGGNFADHEAGLPGLSDALRIPPGMMADKTGQARSNGGLVFGDANWYEIKVLDSYGLEGLDNECGGIYKVGSPAVNMCRPPLMWQTYDIEYHAPGYDADGKRIKPGRISVKHNGVPIHQDAELPDSPAAEKRRQANPESIPTGRIILHYHRDPVEYRNIWLVER